MPSSEAGSDRVRAVFAVVLRILTLLPGAVAAQEIDEFAPFYPDPSRPEVLRLEGEINVRTPFMLGVALRENPGVSTLELDSPGGDVYQALTMVDTIRGAGLNTVVAPGDRCHSACSFLLFAGVERKVGGELGVHQLAASNQQSAQFVMNDVLDVFARLGVPDEVRRRMFQTPPDEIYVFSSGELSALGFGVVPLLAGAVPSILPEASETEGSREAASDQPEAAAVAVAAKPQPSEREPAMQIITVKVDGSGDHDTIAQAVGAAEAGARIEVHPGTYSGTLRVETSVDIVGIGAREKIIIESADTSALRWFADAGSISGVTIRQVASDPSGANGTIEIWRGAPVIRNSDVSAVHAADTSAILVLGTETAPRIIDNRIHDAGVGITITGTHFGGIVEHNEVFRVMSGLHIAAGKPTVRSNRFREVVFGIKVDVGAGGALSNNAITDCKHGLVLSTETDVRTDGNKITHCDLDIVELVYRRRARPRRRRRLRGLRPAPPVKKPRLAPCAENVFGV